MAKEDRQKQIFQYNFKCECIACKENYPSFKNLKSYKEIPSIITTPLMDKLFNFDLECAKKMRDTFKEHLIKYDKYYPCQEVCSVQEGYKLCCNICLKNIPAFSKYK